MKASWSASTRAERVFSNTTVSFSSAILPCHRKRARARQEVRKRSATIDQRPDAFLMPRRRGTWSERQSRCMGQNELAAAVSRGTPSSFLALLKMRCCPGALNTTSRTSTSASRATSGRSSLGVRFGQSSLAFDRLYAEGHAATSSASAYARQFPADGKADVDSIEGCLGISSNRIPPTQSGSTVGPVTETATTCVCLFREPHSPRPDFGRPGSVQSAARSPTSSRLAANSKIEVRAPLVQAERGSSATCLNPPQAGVLPRVLDGG